MAQNDIIAERLLHVAGEPDRNVTVRLARPEPAPDHEGEWLCRLEIMGLDQPCAVDARAEDSLAALLLAVKLGRDHLHASGLRWAWPDGQERRSPIDIVVPGYLLPDQIQSIEHFIRDQEAEFLRRGRERARALGHDAPDPDDPAP